MHRPGTTTPWFTSALTGGGEFEDDSINPDDCYFRNCDALFYNSCDLGSDYCPDWGFASSPLAECVGGPEGSTWSSLGECENPRLDIDNIDTKGIPENINLDNPGDGDTFRVMVHYWGGTVVVHPLVNVYCGGHLLATYGADPDTVSGFTYGGDFGAGPMWRVADITTHVDTGGVTTGCTVEALHPPGSSAGYWVKEDDRSY